MTVTIERKRKRGGNGWEPIATMPQAKAEQRVADMETDDWNRFGHYAPWYRIVRSEA